MATKKTTTKKTINFSKFFPDDDAYVRLKGLYNPAAKGILFDDEFDLDLTIQSATGRYVNLFTWLGDKCNTVDQLKAIHEATGQAIKFYEESMAAKKAKKEAIKVEPRVTKQRK